LAKGFFIFFPSANPASNEFCAAFKASDFLPFSSKIWANIWLNYDAKPNFEKRSTPELIMRACFLMDLQDYSKTTKQGDFKDAADKKGVSEELKQIKAALTDRGFDKEELSNLGLGK
jgi:hypothetical protein